MTPSSDGRRVLIVGLDCASPRYMFDFKNLPLPHLHALMRRGCYGHMRSCDPPITVPAWSCVATGVDPGTLGLYGFRNRRDPATRLHTIATSTWVRQPRIWDIVSEAGKHAIVLGVPQTFPPSPLNGCMVCGLLTPDENAGYAYPPELKQEIAEAVGGYMIDVAAYRSGPSSRLLEDIHALMHNRFDIAEFLMANKAWDLFMMVEIGLDRLQHAFWKCSDIDVAGGETESEWTTVIPDYYRTLDARVGRLLDLAGEDTAIIVVSDHGARRCEGGVCINQWLQDEGYLDLYGPVEGVLPLERCPVDWRRTQAWGEGGYYGRIYLNIAGREDGGVVSPEQYETLRDELKTRIEAMTGPDGRPLGNLALKPEEIYATVEGVAPDLLVYFGGLSWRSVGSLGHDGVFVDTNKPGLDDANHDFHGVFAMDDRSGRGGVELDGLTLLDVAPTALSLLGESVPATMRGRVLNAR